MELNENTKRFLEENEGLLDRICELKKEQDKLDADMDAEKAKVKAWMETNNVKSIDTDDVTVTYTNGFESIGIDSTAFKKKDPALYATVVSQYSKTTVKKPYVSYKYADKEKAKP